MNKKEVLDAISKEFRKSLQDLGVTNGDVIKAVFPNTNIEYWAEYSTYNVEFPNDNDVKHFSYDWWTAPYKAEKEE